MTNDEAIMIVGNIPINPLTVDECYSISQYQEAKTLAIEALKDQKSGYWIEMGQNRDKTHNVICSECKAGFKFRGHANSIHTKTKYKYCPSCGAKMENKQCR